MTNSRKPKTMWWWYSYARYLIKKKGYTVAEAKALVYRCRDLDRKER